MIAKTNIVSKTRNLEATKEAILLAAQDAFASAPFEKVRLREIAKKAGIDVALVNRYYGSKTELFKVVLDRAHESSKLFVGVDRTNLVDALTPYEDKTEGPQKLKLLMIGAYSLSNPEVRLVIQKSSMKYFVKPLTRIIGGAGAKQKALLITSIVMGFIFSNRLIFSEPFTKISQKSAQALRSVIQFVLDMP